MIGSRRPAPTGQPAPDARRPVSADSARCGRTSEQALQIVRGLRTGHSVLVAVASPDSERAGLIEFLDYQREALIRKLDGVSEEDARCAPTVSSLSLLSLVKHSAIWEQRWFQVIVAGRSFPGEWPEVRTDELDAAFQLADSDTVETVVAYYREQIAKSQQILETFDLDALCAWPEMAEQNVRWVALHMIEETARHAGHADIIRETIDGSRGV
jgi:hypothetical protein